MTPTQLAATALAVACGAQPDEIADAVDAFMVAPSAARPDAAFQQMKDIIADQRRAEFAEQIEEWRAKRDTGPGSAQPSGADAAVTRLHAEAVDRFLTEAAAPLNAHRKGEL